MNRDTHVDELRCQTSSGLREHEHVVYRVELYVIKHILLLDYRDAHELGLAIVIRKDYSLEVIEAAVVAHQGVDERLRRIRLCNEKNARRFTSVQELDLKYFLTESSKEHHYGYVKQEEIADHESRIDGGNLDDVQESEQGKEYLGVQYEYIPEFLKMPPLHYARMRSREQHEYKIREDQHNIDQTESLVILTRAVGENSDEIREAVSCNYGKHKRDLHAEEIYEYEVNMFYAGIGSGVH